MAIDQQPPDFDRSREEFEQVMANVGGVVTGQAAAIRMLLAALAGGGHVLLEDYPGTGKTTVARAVARSVGADFARVQFTPDLLPSDILGVSMFDQHEQRFQFRAGPEFTNFLLADEINRASPRIQSALLEAMAEGQATIEGKTHWLDEPFLVILPSKASSCAPRSSSAALPMCWTGVACGARICVAVRMPARRRAQSQPADAPNHRLGHAEVGSERWQIRPVADFSPRWPDCAGDNGAGRRYGGLSDDRYPAARPKLRLTSSTGC